MKNLIEKIKNLFKKKNITIIEKGGDLFHVNAEDLYNQIESLAKNDLNSYNLPALTSINSATKFTKFYITPTFFIKSGSQWVYERNHCGSWTVFYAIDTSNTAKENLTKVVEIHPYRVVVYENNTFAYYIFSTKRF